MTEQATIQTPDKPTAAAAATELQERLYRASQWRLMWRRLKKHRLAMVSLVVVSLLYLAAIFSEFLASGRPDATSDLAHLPPQKLHFFDQGKLRLHVYDLTAQRDPETREWVYIPVPEKKIPVHLFGRGFRYKVLGLIRSDRHLLSIDQSSARGDIYFLGTDDIGRDMWSRLVFATRISMSIGLVGVTLSLLLGITIGGISGLYGGWVDTIIQRGIEIIRSIPTIPLWMGLAAALPRDWSVLKVYFAITIIISLLGWTQLARVVRGKFLSLREEDFVMAARLAGCGPMRIIFRHLVPNFISHIIAATTLAIPGMILSETALSFLGLGLRSPAVSWGVLLQKAQNVQTITQYPWLLLPAVAVIAAVLAFNFLGDGLRDAADPYAR
jgi:peptide/nickel transport system permease protein